MVLSRLTGSCVILSNRFDLERHGTGRLCTVSSSLSDVEEGRLVVSLSLSLSRAFLLFYVAQTQNRSPEILLGGTFRSSPCLRSRLITVLMVWNGPHYWAPTGRVLYLFAGK
jgi:hypothetical protein